MTRYARAKAAPGLVGVNDGVENQATGIGTLADPATAGRPTLDHRLTLYEIEALYTTEAVVQRLVDELPLDAIQAGWTVDGEPAPKWFKRHAPPSFPLTHTQLVSRVSDAARNARRTGAGGLILVHGGDLAAPDVNDGDVINVLTFDKWEVDVARYEEDVTRPNYGYGATFEYSPTLPGGNVRSKMVDRQNIVMFPGSPLPRMISNTNNGFDDSVVQPAWNAIRAFFDAHNGMATMIRKFETATLSVAGLASTEMQDEQFRLFQRRMELFAQTMSILNIALTDANAGEKFERQFASVGGFSDLWDRLAYALAAAAKMPMTKLFGLSPGGLSTDDASGRANWRTQVSAYQTHTLGPALEVMYRRITGKTPGSIEFEPFEVLTAEEQVRVDESRSRSLVAYVTAAILSPDEARSEMARTATVNPATVAGPAPIAPPEGAPDPAVNPLGSVPTTPANPTNREGRPPGATADAEPSFKPNAAMRDNARRALSVRSKKPASQRGMTPVGLARARDIANGRALSLDTVKRIKAYLDRHEADKQGETWADQGPGWQAWNGWGGDAAKGWASAIIKRMEDKG
jgi:phage-related protein (TIGR01555 family)